MSIQIKDLKEHQIVYGGQPNLSLEMGQDSDVLKLRVVKRRFYLKEVCRYSYLTQPPEPYSRAGNNGLPDGFCHQVDEKDVPYVPHYFLSHQEPDEPHFYVMGRHYLYVTEVTLEDDCGVEYILTDKDKDFNGLLNLKIFSFRLFRKEKQAQAWAKQIIPNQEFLVSLVDIAEATTPSSGSVRVITSSYEY